MAGNTVTALRKADAAIRETIELNDTQTELEKARFDHDTKMLALQHEFAARRDALRAEYHARVAEITAANGA
jgi:hypothetical protein